jgi:hypothetical protein
MPSPTQGRASRGLPAHNHPSGDPTPSQADIHMTKAIVQIATPLGISVHDHIIRRQERSRELEGDAADLVCWLSGQSGHAQIHRNVAFRPRMDQTPPASMLDPALLDHTVGALQYLFG